MNDLNNLVTEISDKINTLNLSIENTYLSEKIILMAIKSIKNFIKHEINPFIEFDIIKDIFIDLVIGEYLALIKTSNIQHNIPFNEAIKSIKEGDISITYFENNTNDIQSVINYFLDKKKLLYKYKRIIW